MTILMSAQRLPQHCRTWGDGRATDCLITTILDRDPLVRGVVVTALGALKDRRAVEPLSQLLAKDSDHSVRAMAATSLGQIGDPRAIDALTGALSDDYPSVRDSARGALSVIPRR